MLVNGRPEMVKRAIQAFEAQTYEMKVLFVFDSGSDFKLNSNKNILSVGVKSWCESKGIETVGELRNYANLWTTTDAPLLFRLMPDLLCHWDSDDWSHPARLQEQVALLEMTGKECVGYSDMLFWQTAIIGSVCGCNCHIDPEHAWASESCTRCDGTGIVVRDIGQDGSAWLWQTLDKRQPIGTSLMYRRSAWERVKFLATPNKAGATGEEYHWLKQVDALAVTSLPDFHGEAEKRPRMIASIHGSNTQYYDPADYVEHNRGTSWARATEWDAVCRKEMAL
jgi:hypothetical protein